MLCSFCHQPFGDEGWECNSCGEAFCVDTCFDMHFQAGPHEVVAQGEYTAWSRGKGHSWPRELTGKFSRTDDGSGRGIWIPAVEPDEWL